ncbi:MAG: DUF2007 domain-containing protein [Bacteroidia bacterium]|nr:DUF2007 domain-containing protein [Bacteroidia bacterium]NNF32394.1 DUF2007 domain-containing protein [Flavobacteriaceae bacterium]NNJ83171.1 DUF2007 domain-containing protein [Flavobacteriaceae bacterium]NNK55434.1 DUF2007 domain-containing protein [Flavobacteriaceae bacterium]
MSDKSEFVDIYSGSEVRVILLKGLLEKSEIDVVVQNDYQSGITAGFGGGTINTVRLKVHESDLEKTKPIVEDFIKNQE